MSTWLLVVAAGTMSFGLRFAPLVLLRGEHPPRWLAAASPHVLPAAFAGLAASSIHATTADGIVAAAPTLAGVLVAGAVAHRRSSGTAGLLVGLPTLWLLAAVLP